MTLELTQHESKMASSLQKVYEKIIEAYPELDAINIITNCGTMPDKLTISKGSGEHEGIYMITLNATNEYEAISLFKIGLSIVFSDYKYGEPDKISFIKEGL